MPAWSRNDWYCDEVLSGKLAVERVYANAEALAFHLPPERLEPGERLHVMVIPTRDVETLLDLGPHDAPLMMGMLDAVQQTARRLGLDASGFRLRINCLPPYQHTPHIHWHLIVDRQPAE